MKNIKVKICGIRSLGAAQSAIDFGADYVGFNFVASSKRYIDPKSAQGIAKLIKGNVRIVGVFQNEKPQTVRRIADMMDLDLVQLHGDEDEVYMQKINRPIIKSTSVRNMREYFSSDFLLIDRETQGIGNIVDLDKARGLAERYVVFFAGGLTPENVKDVVKKVRPFAVDVAGGIETNGREDVRKIKKFIKNAKGAHL